MSEEILNALMQLFALASNIKDITNESRKIINHSLRTELTQKRADIFLARYDAYIKEYHSGHKNYEEALNAENVTNICSGINSSLNIEQKYIVLLRLLEYIYADGNISDHESNFVKLLCATFKITERVLNEAEAFTVTHPNQLPDFANLMVVSNNQDYYFENSKHINTGNFDGILVVLHLPEVNLFVFRYIGTSALFLNGQAVTPKRTYIFNSGSALRGNKMVPVYFSDILATYLEQQQHEKISFQAKDVSFTFPSGDVGLHPFNLSEKNGRLVGIMGGSGAGKSTMLNVLNGNYSPSHGAITINGIDIHKDPDHIKGVIGFISQDDLLIEELTVFQNLYYSAKLCLDQLNEEELVEKCMRLLKSLGLYDVRDLKVGDPIDKVISGGQRKRVNIALELIREPSVLFVDEPTSGLSSRDSENIMDLMKELALKGKLVFIVIHQPSSNIFKLFDRLMILDQGGYVIYYGEPLDSVTYFKTAAKHIDADENECLKCGNVNSELIFDIIEQKVINEFGHFTNRRKKQPKEWYKRYLKRLLKTQEKNSDKEFSRIPNSLFTPHFLKQFWLFLKRDVVSKATNKQYVLINLLEAPVLAFFISFFVRYSAWGRHGQLDYKYFNNENIPAYIFMAVVVALFIGMTVSAEEIFKDRKLQKREKFLNLSHGSYLLSKVSLMLVISAIQSFLFVIVGNSILEIADMNFTYWAVMFSTAFFANMVGLNISASFNSAVTIYIIIPFLIIPQLIFSGVIVSFDRLNPAVSSRTVVPVIGEVMASKWAYEALMVSQFKDNPLEKEFYSVDRKMSKLNYLKNYWLPELESEIQFIHINIGQKEEEKKINDIGKIIQFELTQKRVGIHFPVYQFSSPLTFENVSEERLEKLLNYLTHFKKYLNKEFSHTAKERDKVIYKVEKQYGEETSFNDLKDTYFNESVSSLVKRDNKFTNVIAINNQLFQLSDPVMRDATGFRSHFYAANKRIGNTLFDTLWYNIVVLWTMSLALYGFLYFDVLKRVLRIFGGSR